MLPQPEDRLYLGLTDVAVDHIEDVPTPTAAETTEMVDTLGVLLGRPIESQHVLDAYAGLRPLLDSGSSSSGTADISRQDHVSRGEHHAVHVVGGKLTTYRRMAQDAVDAVIEHAGLFAGPGRTTTLPLIGAAPRTQLAGLSEPPLRVAAAATYR